MQMAGIFPLPDNSLPAGFMWSAVQAGIKASGRADLAVATAPNGAAAAAMYTSNRMTAAPLQVDRAHMAASGGEVRAVLVNSGNANCATGEAGIEACNKSCAAAAEIFGCAETAVFPSSTGIIGVPLPVDKLIAALPAAKSTLGATSAHAEEFARAIMTTDTRPKAAHAEIAAGGKTVRLLGFAKGAGMIHPQLVPHATMLVYLFTDLEIAAAELQSLMTGAIENSFNCISIDGDTSTNDTVLLLASGASGVKYSAALQKEFSVALEAVCRSLAHQIVDDGEGVSHVVTLVIQNARTVAEARTVAKAIAHSPLCKTAWSSGDPNWGRLIAAAGYSGVAIEPEKTSIYIGPLPVFERGTRSAGFDEAATHAVMEQREFTITMDLGQGEARCHFVTCDLTAEYVSINADYST
jgi:glutamate N-acetyltransferase/amino-acid N-acetyltransferase